VRDEEPVGVVLSLVEDNHYPVMPAEGNPAPVLGEHHPADHGRSPFLLRTHDVVDEVVVRRLPSVCLRASFGQELVRVYSPVDDTEEVLVDLRHLVACSLAGVLELLVCRVCHRLSGRVELRDELDDTVTVDQACGPDGLLDVGDELV